MDRRGDAVSWSAGAAETSKEWHAHIRQSQLITAVSHSWRWQEIWESVSANQTYAHTPAQPSSAQPTLRLGGPLASIFFSSASSAFSSRLGAPAVVVGAPT